MAKLISLLCGLCLIAGTQIAYSHDYAAGLENSAWNLDPAPLRCRLWQAVPRYGEVGFEAKSGEEQRFYVESERPVVAKGNADIKVVAPFWRPGIEPKELGSVKSAMGKRPLNLGKEWADRFLDELQVGLSPSFLIMGWHDNHRVEVDVSAVNFQDAYLGYMSCLASLYPANFDQLKNTTVNFDTDKWRLTKAMKERLDLIAGYVSLDPEVNKIFVHGHTDSVGRRGHNWELSRLRSKAVMDYLMDKGVEPSMLGMNYWGETRPKVKNSNVKNKAINRRVYVSMVKS